MSNDEVLADSQAMMDISSEEEIPLDDPLEFIDESLNTQNLDDKTPLTTYFNAFFLTIATVLVRANWILSCSSF